MLNIFAFYRSVSQTVGFIFVVNKFQVAKCNALELMRVEKEFFLGKKGTEKTTKYQLWSLFILRSHEESVKLRVDCNFNNNQEVIKANLHGNNG